MSLPVLSQPMPISQAVGVVGARVDELERKGVMAGSALAAVRQTIVLSVLASSSLRLEPSLVLSLLNLLPPGSYTRLRSQMLWPLSRALCSARCCCRVCRRRGCS